MDKLEYYYTSPTQFLAALNMRPIQVGMLGTSSPSSEDRSQGDWSGTNSYADALRLADKGDEEVAKKIRPKDVLLTQHGAMNKIVYDYAGDNVDMGRYMSGEPECMMSLRRKGKPIVNILVNIGASCDINPKIIQARGKAILEIMSGLEANGYGVDITLICETRGWRDLRYRVQVKVKDSKEYFNLQLLSYWLVNPSVLRRLNFRHREQEPPIIQDAIGYGYGTTTDVPQEDLDEMPDCVYFPAVRGNDTGQYQRAIDQITETYKP